jgi:DHA2 family integral membrane protein (MFS transporter)
VYVSELAGSSVAATLPDGVRETAQESVGAAQVVAGGLGDAAPAFLAEVSDAFLAGLGVACLVTAAAALAGAAFAARFLPPRAVDSAQAAEPTTVLR